MLQHLALLAALAWAAVPAAAQQPIPDGIVRHGTLLFDGRATLGSFVGKTDSVWGEMRGGPTLAAVRGWVLGSTALLTGDRQRDKDLKKSMETSRFPTMRFDLLGVTPDGEGDSVAVTLQGALTIHGVRKDVELRATVVRAGDEFRVRSDFLLHLKDYEIGGLSRFLGLLKMQEDIGAHVDVVFGPRP